MNVERMINEMAWLTARVPPPAEMPSKLHVGEEAWTKLQRTLAIHPGYPMVIDQMYGVPIVVGADKSATPLDPYGWRLISRAGTVISEGVLTP